MYQYRTPKYKFELSEMLNEKYLYIEKEDPNVEECYDKKSFIFFSLKNFYIKKDGLTLTLGNEFTKYSLVSNNESDILNWFDEIKKTIS